MTIKEKTTRYLGKRISKLEEDRRMLNLAIRKKYDSGDYSPAEVEQMKDEVSFISEELVCLKALNLVWQKHNNLNSL